MQPDGVVPALDEAEARALASACDMNRRRSSSSARSACGHASLHQPAAAYARVALHTWRARWHGRSGPASAASRPRPHGRTAVDVAKHGNRPPTRRARAPLWRSGRRPIPLMNSKTRARPLRSRERTSQPLERMSRSTRSCLFSRRSRTNSSRSAAPRVSLFPPGGPHGDQLARPNCGSTAMSVQTPGQFLRIPANADQIDHLTTELRGIRRTGSGQLMSLL